MCRLKTEVTRTVVAHLVLRKLIVCGGTHFTYRTHWLLPEGKTPRARPTERRDRVFYSDSLTREEYAGLRQDI